MISRTSNSKRPTCALIPKQRRRQRPINRPPNAHHEVCERNSPEPCCWTIEGIRAQPDEAHKIDDCAPGS